MPTTVRSLPGFCCECATRPDRRLPHAPHVNFCLRDSGIGEKGSEEALDRIASGGCQWIVLNVGRQQVFVGDADVFVTKEPLVELQHHFPVGFLFGLARLQSFELGCKT